MLVFPSASEEVESLKVPSAKDKEPSPCTEMRFIANNNFYSKVIQVRVIAVSCTRLSGSGMV